MIVSFLCASACPGGWLLVAQLTGNEPQASAFEQRALAPWPSAPQSTAQWQALPARFEAAFGDRFAGRETMIRWHNYARLNWLGMPPAVADHHAALAGSAARGGAGEVLAGRDGWLFFTGDRVIDDYRCTRPFATEELTAWTRVLRERRDWLAARGIAYVLVLAPNKHTVYGEFLPESITRIGGVSRLDQLTAALAAVDDFHVIDLRAALLPAKKHVRVYHRTDTHWNDAGAFVAAEEIAARLTGVVPGVSRVAAPDSALPFVTRERPTAGGDLANMLGLADLLPEDRVELILPQPLRAMPTEPLFAPPGLTARSYMTSAATGGGDSGGEQRPAALILHDSFGEALAPFLGDHFRRTDFLHTYDFAVAQAWLEQLPLDQRPQVVIQEYVERIFQVQPPK